MSGGVVTAPRDGPTDLVTLRGGTGRSICIPGQIPLPVILLPVRGDPRHRCADTQLASGPLQICVSPVSLLTQTPCKVREDEE